MTEETRPGMVRVSRTQIAAAKALIEFDRRRGREPEEWAVRIANAKTGSDSIGHQRPATATAEGA